MIKLIMLFILLNISLFARTNPFESDTFVAKMETKTNTQAIEKKEIIQNVDDGNRTVKVEQQVSKLPKIVKMDKVLITKPLKVKKDVKLSKKEIEKICKVENKKQMKKKKIISKVNHFTPSTFKVLPFVTIDVDKEDLKITSRSKYPIINYYTIKNENKLVFNFSAKVNFYTRYKKLDAPKFKSYAVGNHKDENFFRVVIVVEKNIKNYEVIIKNNTAKIIYK